MKIMETTNKSFEVCDSQVNAALEVSEASSRYSHALSCVNIYCDTQSYWGSGLCSSSSIQEIRKHVSETGSVIEIGSF
jgi:hypothetical protein